MKVNTNAPLNEIDKALRDVGYEPFELQPKLENPTFRLPSYDSDASATIVYSKSPKNPDCVHVGKKKDEPFYTLVFESNIDKEYLGYLIKTLKTF